MATQENTEQKKEITFTPGPHFVGVQNDTLYIIAGDPASPDNDHPFHERKNRKVLARIYDSGDREPIIEGPKNATLYAAATALYDVCKRLADWSSKYPREQVHSTNQEVDAQLIAIENAAKDAVAQADGTPIYEIPTRLQK